MNNISIGSQNNRLIKSWFGFLLGAICTGVNLFGLLENFTLAGILSTLGFFCFWYLWSHTTVLNNPIKNFFTANDQTMSRLDTYLALTATILLLGSTIIRFIN